MDDTLFNTYRRRPYISNEFCCQVQKCRHTYIITDFAIICSNGNSLTRYFARLDHALNLWHSNCIAHAESMCCNCNIVGRAPDLLVCTPMEINKNP